MRLISFLTSALIGGAALMAAPVQATVVSFDFTKSASTETTTFSSSGGNGWGNVYSYTDKATGLTATVTAWSLTSGNSNLTFESSRLGQHGANYGLGICNRDETSCGEPVHAADSNGGDDFFLIRFSAPVDPASVTIRPIVGAEICGRFSCTVTSDADVSYAIGNLSSGNLSGMTLGQIEGALGRALTFDANVYTAASQVVTLTNTGAFNALLLGARDTDNDSFFKLVSLSVDYTPAGNVPVPGTVALLGLAALGLGVARRRG